ncbi:hypothetical protein L4C36_16120 [Photobacterium japonica]|uniref:hypothetical protein n=1 Tax=Photobacterium japonica TaxID=2910235 RepID=UPI003D10D39E
MINNEYFSAEEHGFSYPDKYREYISVSGEIGELRWWFIGSSKGLFEIAYKLVNEELESSIELFPFAKSSETNALACFDKSGKVYFVIGYNSLKKVDWSNRLTTQNIVAWYQGVSTGVF